LPVVTALTAIGAAAPPECTPVPVTPPSLDTQVADWPVIALPLSAPIVNVTVNEPVVVVVDPDIATTFVGGAGEPTITGDDSIDWAPVPTAFTAATRNAYAAPFDKPVNV
jgi:hypothetical protein